MSIGVYNPDLDPAGDDARALLGFLHQACSQLTVQ